MNVETTQGSNAPIPRRDGFATKRRAMPMNVPRARLRMFAPWGCRRYHPSMSPVAPSEPWLRYKRQRQGVGLFIAFFWIAQFSLLTTMRMLFVPGEGMKMLLPRVLVTLVAVAVSFGILALQRRIRGRSIPFRMLAAVAMALVASMLHSVCNLAIFHLFFPKYYESGFDWMNYFAALVQWFWSYAAISGMLFALNSSFDVEDREREIGQLQRVAHEAQLRALRYQLNPHFMFNTLNSIAALISRKKVREAESMVENLADFLRAGLSLDPLEDIALSREIELQSLYLAIETVRFVDRLHVTFEVPEDIAQAMVPSLITQPLIENVIRHAVVDTAAPIDLAISARREGDELIVTVINTVPDHAPRERRGTGVGLVNVQARLAARYDTARFRAGLNAEGRYEVRFAIPFSRETMA